MWLVYNDKKRRYVEIVGCTKSLLKGVEYAMNYIDIFQNAEALLVYVGNYYSED